MGSIKAKGIIPAPKMLDATSTAEKISKSELKSQKRDEREIEKIRATLIEEAFGITGKEYKEMLENKEKFEKDLAERTNNTEFDSVKQSMNVANGALGAERASDRSIGSTLVNILVPSASAVGTTALSGAATAGLVALGMPSEVAVGSMVGAAAGGTIASVGASATTAATVSAGVAGLMSSIILTPAIAGGIIATVAVATVLGVITIRRIIKRKKGEASDSIEKERKALEDIKSLMQKIEDLNKIIEKDMVGLLEKKKTMGKKEFKKYLEEYGKKLKDSLNSLCPGINEGITEIQFDAQNSMIQKFDEQKATTDMKTCEMEA